ncbi:hypothetical protein B5M42_016840 [Paenibacillus athensensis]|uniref:Uncharacterized protein n=1 Tax=Paenibacillus athensensis TaxID=1967502 RepID=A0A4Y8Q1H5_9BACL|nr:hypothetical protein [Paenibacillus athensensis]MCD1260469.1 hypothetical protein [Paenibacillus athensensis]
MKFSKICQCQTPEGNNIVVNICITDSAWDKCNADTQNATKEILGKEPIPLLGPSGKGDGIKNEGGHWVVHTPTKQRLSTSQGVSWGQLQYEGLTFDSTYNH